MLLFSFEIQVSLKLEQYILVWYNITLMSLHLGRSTDLVIAPGSEAWQAFSLPEGSLYIPANMPMETATTAAGLLLRPQQPKNILGRGVRGGRVYAAAEPYSSSHVVKVFGLPEGFDDPDFGQSGDEADLRATVLLKEGLEQLDQTAEPWIFYGADVRAAYVGAQTQARWLMRRVMPVGSSEPYMPEVRFDEVKKPALPARIERIARYNAAVALAAGSSDAAPDIFHDDRSHNLLLAQKPRSARFGARQGIAVKIDTEARSGYDF